MLISLKYTVIFAMHCLDSDGKNAERRRLILIPDRHNRTERRYVILKARLLVKVIFKQLCILTIIQLWFNQCKTIEISRYGLSWITIMVTRVVIYLNVPRDCGIREKLLADHPTCDKKIVIHDTPYDISYILQFHIFQQSINNSL